MKKRLLTPLLLLMLLASATAIGQTTTVHFGYDANGNRVSRSLTIRKMEDNGILIDSLESPLYLGEAKGFLGHALLSLYPNPTHGKLTVTLQGMGDEVVSARLLALTGTVIEQTNIADGARDFDLSGLPPGVYLLQLSAPNVSQTWKIIKR
jgi:hypothetical protein